MDNRLDDTKALPLYYQLKECLREKVESEEWLPGFQLPSEPDLAKQFGVSRATVRRALGDLTAEGVFLRKHGTGTFVATPKIEQDLTKFYSFSRDMEAKGLKPSSRVLSLQQVVPSLGTRKALQLEENEFVYELHRLRLVAEEPFIIERSILPVKFFQDMTIEKLKSRALYDLMELEYGIVPAKAVEYFEPVLASGFESEMLGIEENSPALLIHRVAYTSGGRPVELCKSVVRGDRCRYYVSLP